MSTQCAGTELIGPLVAQECRVSTVRIPVRLLLWLVGQECTICEKIIPKQLLLWLIAQECKDSDRRNPLLLLWWLSPRSAWIIMINSTATPLVVCHPGVQVAQECRAPHKEIYSSSFMAGRPGAQGLI